VQPGEVVMRKPGIKGLSLGDQRDMKFSYRETFPAVEVPNVVSLICSPVADQADLGSCGSFAAVYNMVATAVQNDQEPVNLSQLFLYYAYRERYGNVNSDDGVMLRDLLKTLLNVGICREETWPYTLANWNKKPPPAAYEEAAQHKIKSYHALTTKTEMIQCLASGYGFIGGIGCYDSFDSSDTEKTGVVALPGPGEKLLGWHALYFGGGYDLHKDVVRFENSYGKGWGWNGFGTIPFDYLTNQHLAGDFWAIRS
jgi:C1A family cysteine protease